MEHLGEDGFVVLEVSVHDGDEGSGGGEHAFDAGGGEAAAADAMEGAEVGVGAGEVLDDGSSAVG